MGKKALAIFMALAVLAACSPTAEYRIRHRLIDIGLSKAVSHCIADRVTDRFSNGGPFAALDFPRPREKVRAATVEELLPQIRSWFELDVFDELAQIGRRCERRIAG